MTTAYDPRVPGTLADPYPSYAKAAEEGAVVYSELLRAWLILRYDEAMSVLKSRSISAAWNGHKRPYPPDTLAAIQPLNDWFHETALFSDPPDHTRLRNLMVKAFTPRRIAALRPAVERLADELIDGVYDRGEMEFVDDFAYPFPLTVIAELLGIPVADRAQLRGWSEKITTYMANKLVPHDFALAANESIQALDAYIESVVEQRRAEPADDLLSAMIAAEDDGQRLGTREIVVQAGLLLLAGHETTTNLLGLTLHTLFEHPAQLAAVRANPELVPPAIEEVLRYESSVQFTSRIATEDMTIAGADIKRGDDIYICFGAVGRDGAVFERPDEFDIDRRDIRNFSFGAGLHYCVGAALARMEMDVALRALLARLPNLRPTSTERLWRPVVSHRGLRELPVAWDA